MDRTFVLATQTGNRLNLPDRGCGADRVTRPVSLIHRDVHARNAKPSVGMSSGRSIKSNSKSSRSPMVRREIHYRTGSASQSPTVTRLEGESPATNHTGVCNDQKNQNMVLGIFIILTGGNPNYIAKPGKSPRQQLAP